MNNIVLLILLIGQPKLSPVGCKQVTDMLITIVVKDMEQGGKPSGELHEVKHWHDGCLRVWKK